MLTRARLMVGSWQTDATGEGRVRYIRDPGGAALGMVRACAEDRRPWWRFWSAPSGLEVFETDDHALVMSLRPSRIAKSTWLVLDCDGNEVGRLRGEEILDPWNTPFARRAVDDAGTWALRESDGRDYATCATGGDSDEIVFLEPALTNPFLRMLVIGSFLLLRAR
jgi:hypothetical protein